MIFQHQGQFRVPRGQLLEDGVQIALYRVGRKTRGGRLPHRKPGEDQNQQEKRKGHADPTSLPLRGARTYVAASGPLIATHRVSTHFRIGLMHHDVCLSLLFHVRTRSEDSLPSHSLP